MTSIDLLRKSLESWSAFAGRKLTDQAQEQWVHLFESIEPGLLEQALRLVTAKCRRMPWPGDLSEAIDLVRERRGFGETRTAQAVAVSSRDPQTNGPIPAWIYPEDPKQELHYRPQDCAEGRAFLDLLHGKRKSTYPPYRPCTSYKDKLHQFDHHGKGGRCACGFVIPF